MEAAAGTVIAAPGGQDGVGTRGGMESAACKARLGAGDLSRARNLAGGAGGEKRPGVGEGRAGLPRAGAWGGPSRSPACLARRRDGCGRSGLRGPGGSRERAGHGAWSWGSASSGVLERVGGGRPGRGAAAAGDARLGSARAALGSAGLGAAAPSARSPPLPLPLGSRFNPPDAALVAPSCFPGGAWERAAQGERPSDTPGSGGGLLHPIPRLHGHPRSPQSVSEILNTQSSVSPTLVSPPAGECRMPRRVVKTSHHLGLSQWLGPMIPLWFCYNDFSPKQTK